MHIQILILIVCFTPVFLWMIGYNIYIKVTHKLMNTDKFLNIMWILWFLGMAISCILGFKFGIF